MKQNRFESQEMVDSVGFQSDMDKNTAEAIKLLNTLNDIAKVGKTIKIPTQKALKDISTDAKKATTDTNALTTADKELLKIQKQIAVQRARQTPEYKKLNAEKQKAAALQNKENAAIRKQVTGQKGLSKSLGNLVKSMATYLLAMVAVQRVISFFTTDLLNMTKALDSIDYSMKTVIKSQGELAATYEFLSKTAINYGHDILTLTGRYVKFRAATLQSNMSARQTMQIFDSTAKAAGVLGLKTDEVNGVFLALEQMISKGKVTTEELRRQLGERLPGAMGIMADAIGVSIIELDKMLKAGTVLSAEALPKFAIALEKAYGIEAVTVIDTLAAAQGRLRTSWVLFVKELNASKDYITTFRLMNDLFIDLQLALGGDHTNMLALYSQYTTEAGIATRDLKESFNSIDFDRLTDQQERLGKKWVDIMTDAGIQTFKAKEMFVQYMNLRKSMLEDEVKTDKSALMFDASAYSKSLSKAKIITATYAKLTTETLKEFTLAENELTAGSDGVYINILEDQQKQLEIRTLTYKNTLKNLTLKAEELNKNKTKLFSVEEEGLTAKERLENQTAITKALKNYNSALEASAVIEAALYDEKNKGNGKSPLTGKSPLDLQRIQNEIALNEFKLNLEKESQKKRDYFAIQYGDTERFYTSVAMLKDTDSLTILKKEEELHKNLYDVAKLGKDDLLKLDKETSEFQVEVQEKRNQNMLSGAKSINTLLDHEEKQLSDDTIDEWYDKSDKVKSIAAQSMAGAVKKQKLHNDEILKLQRSFALAEIKIEIDAVKEMIASSDLTDKAKEEKMAELDRLKQAYAEQEVANQKSTSKALLKDKTELYRGIADVAMGLANLINELGEAELQRARARYEDETKFAGTSVEKQLIAKREYEQEEKKIKTRMAIANKLAAIFDITLQLAIAGAELNAFQVIAAGLAIAAVAATPIPSYEKGGKNKEGKARVSEKGRELHVDDKGMVSLLPDTESIVDLPAGEVIPNPETERMLANYAINQSWEQTDMRKTNNILSNINEGIRNTPSMPTIENGFKVTRKGNTTIKIRI